METGGISTCNTSLFSSDFIFCFRRFAGCTGVATPGACAFGIQKRLRNQYTQITEQSRCTRASLPAYESWIGRTTALILFAVSHFREFPGNFSETNFMDADSSNQQARQNASALAYEYSVFSELQEKKKSPNDLNI